MSHLSQIKCRIWSASEGSIEHKNDLVAVEEPLEIKLSSKKQSRTIAITMRTPGHDYDLTAGFLYSEGILKDRRDFVKMSYCVGEDRHLQEYNQIRVELRRDDLADLPQLERHFFTNSACGVCGKTMIEDLHRRDIPPVSLTTPIHNDVIQNLPVALRKSQKVFDRTGGLHAAAIFDSDGALIVAREDIGRHNATDKLLGWGLLNDELPFRNRILMVSGRASFELLQKCAVAATPVFCAVSAPSSLAVSLAQYFNITLIGFLRDNRFNIYTNPQNIKI